MMQNVSLYRNIQAS